MFHSLRWRLVASFVLVALISAALVGLLAQEIVRRTARQQELDDLQSAAQSIAQQALPLLFTRSRQADLDRLTQAAGFAGQARVRILDSQGWVLADSGMPAAADEWWWLSPQDNASLEGRDSFPEAWIVPGEVAFPQISARKGLLENLSPDGSIIVMRRESSPWGSRFSIESLRLDRLADLQDTQLQQGDTLRSSAQVRAPIGSTQDPIGYVELSSIPDLASQALSITRQAFLLAGIAAALLAALVGLLISRRLISPLRSLADVAAQMETGDLTVRAEVQTKDEIGILALRFNQMAERLQSSFEQLAEERDAARRFLADASHELRTPMTALKSFICLLQGPARQDPAAQAEFLQESQAQVERLEWLMTNLLDLSRLDAGLYELEKEQVSVADLIEAAASPYREKALQRGIELEILPGTKGLSIIGERAYLELALSNLLDNALKFTPSGGHVTVRSFLQEKNVIIEVQDDGPGIAAEDLPHILERFFRGRGAQAAGSGLGLAIVESVVHAHSGRIEVKSQPDQGTTFWIYLLPSDPQVDELPNPA